MSEADLAKSQAGQAASVQEPYLMLAGILRYGYDSVTYENVQYSNKVRAHLDIPANEIALAGIVLGYRSDDKANSHRSPRSNGRGDFNDHIRRE